MTESEYIVLETILNKEQEVTIVPIIVFAYIKDGEVSRRTATRPAVHHLTPM